GGGGGARGGGRGANPNPPGGAPADSAPAGAGPNGPERVAAAGAPPVAPGGRGARPPAPIEQMNNPHGNMVDLRDPSKPILLVADRGHGRIVRYTLDDKPIDIVEGTRQPCHFHSYKELVV